MSPFYVFRHHAVVQNSHHSSNIRFSQDISSKYFFDTIRISDVVSEVKCISLKRGGGSKYCAISETLTFYLNHFSHSCTHLSQHAKSELLNCFAERQWQLSGVSIFLNEFLMEDVSSLC